MNPTIIKKEDAQLAEPVQLRDPSPASTSCATAGVRIHETNGHVQAIEVTCACGETTVIELEYSREEATS
jgi:hypothetical protein